MIDLKIAKKNVQAKFGFGALFSANEKFSSVDGDGNSLQDGAANLFVRLINDDMTVLPDILSVSIAGKFTDDQFADAIDELTENGDKIDETMAEFKEELLTSGFFNKAIHKQIKMLEEMIPFLKEKASAEKEPAKKEELSNAATALEKQLQLMKENV